MPSYQTDLDHALHLADAADGVTMRYYRSSDLRVTDKPDRSPVTQGDLETEKALSDIVEHQFHEQYLGEEGVRTNDGLKGRTWVVDPIDGTKSFMRGLPLWGTLIALLEDGITVASVVSMPALGRRWWAAKGLGAWTRDVDGATRQLHTSGIAAISDAFFLASTPLTAWDKAPCGEAAVQKLLADAWRWRAPGDVISYMWLAEGACEASFEPYAKQWDIEAPRLIVTEAGGSFWTSATDTTSPDEERIVIATNGPLQKPLQDILGT